jgi:uncharacterized protein (DUF58 family)
MRSLWSALTARGRALLASGLVVAVLAAGLGQRDLFRVAALLVAVPLVALLLLSRRRDAVSIARILEPAQVEVGDGATVRLRIENVGSRSSGPIHLEDRVDESLGLAPRLLLERLDPGERVETTYGIDASSRGRHQVGPLQLVIGDPFGLVQARRTGLTANTLTVTPVVTPLRGTPSSLRTDGRGDGRSRRASNAGHDDVGTREYRVGDELRRVHWRSTARTGALMVRQEEAPWEGQVLVVLDTRAASHERSARGGPADLTTSSFEWAVHAAASIGVHLAHEEREVRVLSGHHDIEIADHRVAPLLEQLAAARLERDGVLVAGEARHLATPLVIAVLGATDAADVAALQALRSPSATCIAVVLDTATWADRPVTDAQRAAGRDLAAPLRTAGWRTAVAVRGDHVSDVWARAIR